MNGRDDTIAAIATPIGRGGVGIVRISGAGVPAVIEALFARSLMPRHAHFLPFCEADGTRLDQGIALYFPAPHSFTGEDVLELHAHGSPVVLDLLLKRVLTLGVRLARPGEFSLRAFLNGKIDLLQAEAIADLLEASSEHAARCAQRTLQGEFSRRVTALLDALTELRAYVEASIDFVDEDIDFIAEGAIERRLTQVLQTLDQARRAAHQGQVLRDGLRVVIAGRPNAGKSSLLNALSGRDSAIVTAFPGTTRDVLREYLHIDGMPLHILDTAGLRDSDDPVEREGIRRAHLALAQADRILWVSDDREVEESTVYPGDLPAQVLVIRIRNKIDLTGRPAELRQDERGVTIALSAKTGAGIDLLRQFLKESAGYDAEAGDVFSARRRHLDALERARAALVAALAHLESGRTPELLAEELRGAQQALAEITGAYTSDDLLDEIFGRFCIGK